MPVNINTKMITLLGKPLSQSYAARMQNAAYRAAGIDMLYFYTEVENDHLPDVINGIRHMNFAGFAVTKPNKVEVMKYVDEVDPLCEKMNASNTVVIKNGRLKAYNTDGIGFLRSLKEEAPEIDISESVFFCLGAGGAARAICSVLAYNGAKKIYIASRTLSRVKELVEDINEKFAPVAEQVDMQDTELLKKSIAASNVIMNNTGLGMPASLDKTPIPKEYLSPVQLCFDATYNPSKTRFLTEAEQVGCKIINGLGMSLYQGAEQIELWSGVNAPIEAMRQELLDILSGKEEK
ncbi:MAG TPA: shikimate dehydrogenase [Bacillota bacterium]|nr:shikimate dehydrogenase [Clostridiaceae bacterium]HNR05282.1 shikimate dehydrogenase [Bacillota bacterium]HNT03412.1 shikimate dehydrogenase [Bacillota bacterium]HPA53603.1 shikimate dehydrogenase [Bacillota bacterium]HPX68845.1 shikimate dehydrogenase [Bacillota bacterium]